ncbi:helix-turn-helix domain-containing protein [Gordonia sp. L191]|uniref:PucR family transcriptional regulator n=1 Tax=Gordonia sp. L191 TaxID=2982699 RepID=UPI0024BF1BCE|nr:helix-turn-helix domain-containing protein [Gordonia sp. L191]WHU49425.1 helix-turn-helix domain-containing protein [Gordonia sp. L191]
MTEADGDRGARARARLARMPATADAELQEVVTAIARRLRAQEATIVADLSVKMAREIDHLDADPKLVEMLEASVHGNVSTIIHVLANDIPVDHLQPTTAAVEYALRLAQRDVPSNSLVRAYHLGQNEVMLLCYQMIGELGLDADRAMAVTRHISGVMFGYIDWITLYVFQAYEDERRRWLGADATLSSTAIRRVLDGTDTDGRTFTEQTRYRLDCPHLAAIIWSDDDGVDLRRLHRGAEELAVRLRADGPPILTAVDRSTIWAWIPLRTASAERTVGEIDLPPGLRGAFGLVGEGVDGFRRSHEQARGAYAVAIMPGSGTGSVVGFADRGVAIASLLAQDLPAAAAWVREVLGGLADDSPTAATLRETLSVFYATRESHLHTATRLNLHRNTVKYRVGKALAAVPGHRDRLDLALALTVCELLGPSIISGPA